MGMIKTAKGLADKPAIVIPVQILTMIFAIVSIVLVWVAYFELNAAIADVSDMLENWETLPIVEVTVVDYGESCPSGFEEMPATSWPGASTGYCACPSTSGTYTSSTSSCSTNQTDNGCITDPSMDAVSLKSWRGQTTCFRRGGEPAMTWTDSFWRRPNPDADTGECSESGYKHCGTGNFDDDRSICFPDDELCPITEFEVAFTKPSDFPDTYNMSAMYDDGTYLYFARKSSGLLPLVNIEVQLSGAGRGPCYQGGTQGYASSTYSSSGTLSYKTSCTQQDTRYEAFDDYDEFSFLYENFVLDSRCGGVSYTDMGDADYTYSGNACSVGIDCEVTVSESFACRSGDTICQNVINQSKCGKLMHFVNNVRSDSETWSRYARSQIYWSENCEVDEDAIKSNRNPLVMAGKAQYALGVCNTIANVILGFVLPAMILKNLKDGDICCIPGKGKAEYAILKALKTYVGHIFRAMKIIPLVVAVIIIEGIRHFFVELGTVGCSDDLTNSTYEYLAEKLPSVMEKNYATLSIEVLQLIVFLILTLRKCCKKDATVSCEEAQQEEQEEAEKKIPDETQNPVQEFS